MKLFGNRRKSRHADKYYREDYTEEEAIQRTPEEIEEIESAIEAYQRVKLKRRLIILVILIALAIASVVIFYKSTVKPPPINTEGIHTPNASQNMGASNSPGSSSSPETSTGIAPGNRKSGVYTFLVVGNDDGNGNTDTILVGTLDSKEKTLDILSIPRDTLVNVSWEIKKINSVMAMRGDIDGLIDAIKDITGFTVDNYMIVDLEAFVALVDAIDGVEFDIPIDMNYDDPVQDLHIHFSAGTTYLYGEDAVKVVRFRQNNDGTGYPRADIDRIATQQAFLKTVMAKCLKLDSLITNIDDYANIFMTYVDTDLTLGNLVWYGQQVLGIGLENINFHTLPENYNDSIRGGSYCSILIDEWLELLNSSFNPFDEPITESNLNILTRDEDGNLYSTTGTIAGGYDSFYNYYGYEDEPDPPEETDYYEEPDPPEETDYYEEPDPPEETEDIPSNPDQSWPGTEDNGSNFNTPEIDVPEIDVPEIDVPVETEPGYSNPGTESGTENLDRPIIIG